MDAALSLRELDDVRRVLRNATLVLPDRQVAGDLVLARGRIAELTAPGRGAGAESWDLAGRVVTPGLVDLHTHGGWGVDFSTDTPARMASVAPHYARAGVVRLLLTLVSAPRAELLERVAAAAQACALCPAFAGLHLEGPFLARDRRGALPEAGILAYDAGLVEELQRASAGWLRVMTFAPEAIPPAEVRRIQAAGITLSIGHTDGDADATEAAIRAGVHRATHLCNAMPPIHHRAPGPVVALLNDTRVRVEVIADGQHLDDRMLRLILAAKGQGRVQVVSDSMPLAGLGAACGEFAGAEGASDGVCARRTDGTLAGSVTPLGAALARTGVALGLSPVALAHLGATTPALDLPHSHPGRIATGAPADLLILEPDGTVHAALRAGVRADG